MAWTFGVGNVDVWWERWTWKPSYKPSHGYHHLHLPTGLVIRWRRRTGRPSRAQRKRRRAAKWDAVEDWVMRCAIAVGIGVALGLLLRLWVLP